MWLVASTNSFAANCMLVGIMHVLPHHLVGLLIEDNHI
jgi:hypothetical protein